MSKGKLSVKQMEREAGDKRHCRQGLEDFPASKDIWGVVRGEIEREKGGESVEGISEWRYEKGENRTKKKKEHFAESDEPHGEGSKGRVWDHVAVAMDWQCVNERGLGRGGSYKEKRGVAQWNAGQGQGAARGHGVTNNPQGSVHANGEKKWV